MDRNSNILVLNIAVVSDVTCISVKQVILVEISKTVIMHFDD